ncbi:MAG: hypothetical protein JXR82_09065 [Marinifilaceae bacterium]|nr:hypothetical protein [Marinifilaceae bacterium]
MKNKIASIIAIFTLGVLFVFNVSISKQNSNNNLDITLIQMGHIANAAPEYDAKYKYQTMAYCGSSINYACTTRYTAESCRLYACLKDY